MNKDLFNNQKESAGANDNSLGLEEIKNEIRNEQHGDNRIFYFCNN